MNPTTPNAERCSRRGSNVGIWILVALIACLAVGCEAPPPVVETDLYLVPEDEYPVFADVMYYDGLEFSLNQSLAYLNRIPIERTFSFGPDIYTAAHIKTSIVIFKEFVATKPSTEELNDFIRANYHVYRSVGSAQTGDVLFTGY